ncbi:MAG: hypothetical protein H6688_01450 [Erysipelotrichaceae bacterium]|nr:hypothetical protein [Erysipelotrichaceae bacterium]
MGYYYTETNCSESENITDILRIKELDSAAKNGKTFSPSIKGIERYATVSRQVKQFILNDFTKSLTFADIAKRYGLTKQRIIQIFDEKVKYVPRRLMPKIYALMK